VIRGLILLVLTMLAGCGEISSSFDSRAEAELIIRKGWLPPAMPESATEIWESHNLDLNIGRGGFQFGHEDSEKFRAVLWPNSKSSKCTIPWSEMERDKREWFRYSEFHLAVDWKNSDVKFWLCYRDGV